jgi:hypothetical protein
MGKKKGFQRYQEQDEQDDEEDWLGGTKPQKMPRGLQPNPALIKAAEKRLHKVNRSMEQQKVRHRSRVNGGNKYGNDNSNDDVEDGWEDGGRSLGRKRVSYKPSGKLSPRDERRERERLLKNEMRKSVPSLSALLNRLQQKDLLPAIFFHLFPYNFTSLRWQSLLLMRDNSYAETTQICSLMADTWEAIRDMIAAGPSCKEGDLVIQSKLLVLRH